MARERNRHQGCGSQTRTCATCAASTAESMPTPSAICSGSTSTRQALLPDDNVKGNFDNNAAALQVSPSFVDQYISAARAVALEAVGNPQGSCRDDHLRRRRQHGDFPAAGRRSRHRQAAASHRRDAVRHARRLHRRTQFPGRRRIRAHDRRHGARARSAEDGIREHGDRPARRQGVLSHHDRRRSRPQGDRPAAGSRGRRNQRTAAEDPLSSHGRAASSWRSPSASQLRRKRRAYSHHRARGRSGAHPGRACLADPRAALGHRHERVGQPREDFHLPAEGRRATRRPARTRSSRTSHGAPSGAR